VAKSALFRAGPVVLVIVPLTALMWVCQSVPRKTAVTKRVLPTAAIAPAVEDEFECDDWDDPELDFGAGANVPQDVTSRSPCPAGLARYLQPELY
jgi:hypothetical protein